MRQQSRPPGPRGEPVFGNSRQYARDPFSFLTACESAYGDVVAADLGPMETYIATNPADIERILVGDHAKYRKPAFQDDALGRLLGDGLLLSEGDRWRKQRDLANPAFDMSRIADIADVMARHATEAVETWAAGDDLDLELEMARLTVRIIADAMLGVDLGEERVRTIQENLEPLGARFEPDPIRFVTPDWLPTPENRAYEAAVQRLEDVVADVIDERRGTEGSADDEDPPMDLLSILLRAQNRNEQTDEQLRDEVVTMLLAGHDTTALTLTYAFYLLSEHPDAEQRVHAELDDVLNGPPTFADARELTYLDRVLQETMRLYPPVYVMFREPVVDVKLGGYRIPEGAAIMLPQWAVHRSPRWWTEPERFDPDRWTRERRADRPRFAHFPFGGGPRHCIGKHFSLLEAKIILAVVGREYRLEYARDEPFDLRGSLTMHPEDGMPMRVRER
ncbi:cytochrome P450 [Haloplanus rallus]|jgi:cytochrome P450|uniref:Cytochrome P450 n=1 Tax=Haloplanus rallus TaxID=1816183 RepID=A0A6B9FAI3_9EURY|nr:cytochrome P450 [Haloplanus rallus]QGX95574.1 cytochrome P450 [Haloplanus rallus]